MKQRAPRTVVLPGPLSVSCALDGDEGGPAVVFLPGPTDSWRSYEGVLEQLPDTIRAVAVSPRGHGDSDRPPTGYRVEDLAADVVALLDALAIERAVLAGHSGSCLVARRVAGEHPHRVAGLVLESAPTTLRGDRRLQDLVRTVLSDLRDPVDRSFARSFVTGTSSEALAPEVLERLTAEVQKVPAHVWKGVFSGLLDYDGLSDLSRVVAPTLLIWGDGDHLVDRAMQDELVARLPDVALVEYSGVGHTPRWEEPTRFAGDVAAFVEARVRR